MRIDESSVVPTTLKLAEDDDDLIVRAFEAGGLPANVGLRGAGSIGPASSVNFLEDVLGRLSSQSGSLQLSFRPFEIRTVKIGTRGLGLGARGKS